MAGICSFAYLGENFIKNMNKRGPWTTLSVKTTYESPWIEVSHHNVLNPIDEPGIYGVVHFKNVAVGVIPLDADNYTWIVGQYRYPLDAYSWEIPEGGSPVGTDPVASAKRELREETGIIASDWEQILTVHTSNSVTDEVGYVYLARNLTFTKPDPDPDEELIVRKVHTDELFAMVERGEITDSISLAGIMKLQLLLLQEQKG